MVMVGKRGTTTINFNMLGGGCKSCFKGVNSDCFRIAMFKYIFCLACSGVGRGGAVIVVVVDYCWWC